LSIPAFPAYLFDVDGTLVHSAPDICGAIQTALADTEHHDVKTEFLQRYIGRHLNDLFLDLFPAATPEFLEELVSKYRHAYPLRNHSSTQLYPGVIETLQRLGGRKSTATTKGTPTTKLVLERFGLLPYFDHVQGTDGFPAKPQPDVIFAALRGLSAKVEDCLFVGDAVPDIVAAKAAGVKICSVLSGYGEATELRQHQPDFVIERLTDLLPG
jgi:phosphoglycolate phosphatase